eukprot:1809151-Pleurochrysis_carterae.AAC.2
MRGLMCLDRRAQERGIIWAGMLDIDEFWFSQRFGTLERLLAHKYKSGYYGIGQTAMAFHAGPVDGPCSELPPIAASHLWRRCELTRPVKRLRSLGIFDCNIR